MPSPRTASAAIDSSSSTGTWQPSAAFGIQSEAQALEPWRQPALERDRLRDLRLPLHLVPQLELKSLPDEDDALFEARISPQCRRDQDPAGCIDFNVVGMTHVQPLDAADAIVERWERHDLRLDRLPRF